MRLFHHHSCPLILLQSLVVILTVSKSEVDSSGLLPTHSIVKARLQPRFDLVISPVAQANCCWCFDSFLWEQIAIEVIDTHRGCWPLVSYCRVLSGPVPAVPSRAARARCCWQRSQAASPLTTAGSAAPVPWNTPADWYQFTSCSQINLGIQVLTGSWTIWTLFAGLRLFRADNASL